MSIVDRPASPPLHPGIPAFDEFLPNLTKEMDVTRLRNLKVFETLSTIVGDRVQLWDINEAGRRVWANHDENFAASDAFAWGAQEWTTLAATYDPPHGFTEVDLTFLSLPQREDRINTFRKHVFHKFSAVDTKELFDCDNSLENLVRARQDAVTDKVSLTSIAKFCDPVYKVFEKRSLKMAKDKTVTIGGVSFPVFQADIATLKGFAVKGVQIPVSPFFAENNSPGVHLSERYMSAYPAVDFMWYKSYLDRKVLILELKDAVANNCHFQDISWAVKKGSRQGRNTTNCSGVSSRFDCQVPLNDKKFVRDTCIDLWGPIQHPSIIDIAHMVLRAEVKYGRENVCLWKQDIKGAFPQLPIRPEDAHLMASMLAIGLVLINFYGSFGLTVFPFAFEVVTRILRVLINFVIRGEAKIYCDDAIGASKIADREHDMNKSGEQMQILGSQAEAMNKRFWTRSTNDLREDIERTLDVLGWEVNLSHRFIDIAKENRLKALYLFWTVDLEVSVPLETLEAMASLASRYSLIYQELSIIVGPLYRTQQPFGHRFKGATRSFTPEAKVAVRVWRAYFLLAEIRSTQGRFRGRSLDTFAPLTHSGWEVEFDGCLKGIGARVFLTKNIGENLAPGCYRDDGLLTNFKIILPDGNPDTSYQNHMELLSLSMGLLSLASTGVHGVAVKIRGDSVSILSWALEGKFQSPFAISAALVFVAICRRFEFTIRETEFIPSEANRICDARSRGADPSKMLGFQIPFPSHPLRNNCVPHLFGGPRGPTLKLIQLANPITFRDSGIADSDQLMLSHMRDIQKTLDAWEMGIFMPK